MMTFPPEDELRPCSARPWGSRVGAADTSSDSKDHVNEEVGEESKTN
jgi:hypothetical protein